MGAYIYMRQETVAEWVAFRPILEVCNKDTGYEGGGGGMWWRKTASRKKLCATLKQIPAATRDQSWKPGRR